MGVINPKWRSYYYLLESIRREGSCNMWGVEPLLAKEAGITPALAKEVAASFRENYAELNKKYGWQ